MFFSMVLYSVLYYNKFYRGNGYRLIVTIEWLLLNITDFLAIWWHTALVLAVLCLLAYFGSMLIAIRIYRAKEL